MPPVYRNTHPEDRNKDVGDIRSHNEMYPRTLDAIAEVVKNLPPGKEGDDLSVRIREAISSDINRLNPATKSESQPYTNTADAVMNALALETKGGKVPDAVADAAAMLRYSDPVSITAAGTEKLLTQMANGDASAKDRLRDMVDATVIAELGHYFHNNPDHVTAAALPQPPLTGRREATLPKQR